MDETGKVARTAGRAVVNTDSGGEYSAPSAEAMCSIARGDLRFRLNRLARPDLSAGELQLMAGIDEIARRFCELIGRLRHASEAIDSILGHVFTFTQSLSGELVDEIGALEGTSGAVSKIGELMRSAGRDLTTLSILSQSMSADVLQMASSIDHVSLSANSLDEYVEETATAIAAMTLSVKEVAESTERLAESAERTARAMEAIDNSTHQIGESVNETTVLSEEVARSADSGSRLVAETADSMTKIKEAIDAATETIERLGHRSSAIGDATHVITEIADRTNLLAINAAILATQAGAQGRGFRIVADEIKELSERTSSSTRDIEEMIKSVQKDVSEAIERVAVGGLRAADGVELAVRASVLLSEISDKTSAASDRIRSIAGATAIQAAESHNVLEAVALVQQQARGIERATGEQALTGRHISERSAHMSGLTQEVRRATGEQAVVSKQVVAAMEELIHVVDSVRSASQEQVSGIDAVLGRLEALRHIVSRSQSFISGINGAVDSLAREAELVSQETKEFQLPAPERGGHLRFGLRSTQIVFDPAAVSSISRIEVMSNIFEGLVQFGDRAEIRPAVAERWEISPDGCVYTFFIRESARFHNGRRVRADDVKYSFERQLRQNKEAAAWAFRPLAGVEEFLSSTASGVDGIVIESDQVLSLRLARPVAFFLSTLCADYACLVPREEVEKPASDFQIKPVGSGPFRVVEPVLGKEVQLERFSNYWNPELPYVDRLTVSFGITAEEMIEAFLAGDLDYVSDLPLTCLGELRRRAPEIKINEAVQLQTRILVFDCERPPFSDRRVRQAICYAIDRDRFLNEVYGGVAQAARGPIPPGLLGCDPAERGYSYDPARSRLLLDEAGYGDGFDTEIWWLDTVNPAVSCLCDDLAKVGINADIRYVSITEMERSLSMRMAPIAGLDWYAEYPDSDNSTYVLFNSSNRGLLNGTYYSEEVDRLTAEARVVMNRERRAEIYRKVSRLVLEDAPCAFLAHRRSFVAYRPGLEGVSLRLLSPFVTPKFLWFAKQ